MARGRRWTEAENRLLLEMAEQGMSTQTIYESGKFPNRTFQAIQNQLKRLGADLTGHKKFQLTGQISEAEIVELETVVKRFVDAFNKICDLTKCSKQDLERFRIIFSAARVYFDLYFKLQSFEEVRTRVERVEKLVEQLAAEKKAEKA
jgi:cob(I)alamin adenosyltransferase